MRETYAVELEVDSCHVEWLSETATGWLTGTRRRRESQWWARSWSGMEKPIL